ncbi:LLM class flavin-dependent oxidoreductase [Rhizobiaceae bacterium CRRU44]|uniref:LLM class flavin-dependent oxidoreductase n=1 Tax=Ferranicluibacter rubi TaxID=2715133 RepID=A0AA43ZF38_9HYPH|nr:LLM class flavin-dependent oxidoreductase [Ferranicluibacter rubi]NHT76704.1 LLM class flavin-dependent oxidoreductase [Ferranicluibacter rubi]
MTKPYLALGLAGPHLVELTESRTLLSRWDALPVAFSVLGIDRIDGSLPASVTLASSAAGATLAGATKNGRFLIAAAPQRDHPYNIARRVVSLAHLSHGRSGLLIGVRDAYAPEGPAAGPAWGGAGLGGGAPLNAQTASDAAFAVRALEQGWPYDSIIGNRETGILVESNRIVHVDLNSTFSIAGPLNAPAPATGASVIAWHAATVADLPPADADSPIDLMLGNAGSVPVVALGAEPPAGRFAGILLRPSLEQSVGELLDVAERWLGDGFASIPPGGTLRNALDLTEPPPLAPTLRAAFPAPKPHVSL